MSRRSSVVSSAVPSTARRIATPVIRSNSLTPSTSSSARRRRLSTLSFEERTQDDAVVDASNALREEIAEIKRYEDFTTIDWVQDAAREQLRRRTRREEKAGFFVRDVRPSWRRRLWDAYEAGQGWIVITIVGAAIGLIAGALNIVTEWLSDTKRGYCTTAFYLNESFCCWGSESGCDEWKRWSSLPPINYLIYVLICPIFAYICARLVKTYAPYAAGGGVSEIKCIIAGFVMKGFLGFWTLFIKSIGLPLSISSGLSVGKEGPTLHYAVCAGNVIARFFDKYRRNASKMREVLSASAAAGVAVAFASPIGGVLFSLEEMSNHFPIKTLWRSYFCALVATAVLATVNPFRTGQLVMFQVRYDQSWHFFEVIFYVVLGVFGGVFGALLIRWNLRAQAFRKKYLSQYPILEATLLAFGTAIVCYPNMFLRIDMTEAMEILFKECKNEDDYDGLCRHANRLILVLSLLLAAVLRTLLITITYGCKVPAGIFVPPMAVGAMFGRSVGILVEMLHDAYPDSRFFSACQPDVPCITPGTYAFLGAGAALSGTLHVTVSVVVIMFELTGALTYILPSMIVVGVTKVTFERLSHGGIADGMIRANGFPFLDDKEEHSFGVPVSTVMTPLRRITVLPASGASLSHVEQLLDRSAFQGFPVVEDLDRNVVLGYIGRTELRYAIDRAKRNSAISEDTRCLFARIDDIRSASADSSTEEPANAVPPTPGFGISNPFSPITPRPPSGPISRHEQASTNVFEPKDITQEGAMPEYQSSDRSDDTALLPPPILDLTPFLDLTPLSVHPALLLETVMELFKKLGPRVILVDHHGTLAGLVTVKDCLRYQFTAEAAEHSRRGDEEEIMARREERLFAGIVKVASWVRRHVERLSKGKIVLGEPAGLVRDLGPVPASGTVTHARTISGTSTGSVDTTESGAIALEEDAYQAVEPDERSSSRDQFISR